MGLKDRAITMWSDDDSKLSFHLDLSLKEVAMSCGFGYSPELLPERFAFEELVILHRFMGEVITELKKRECI